MTQEFLQSYFHADFKGIESLVQDVLVPLFGESEQGWTELTATDTLREKAANVNISRIKHAAQLSALGFTINVFDVTLKDNCHIHKARKGIQTLIRQYVEHFQGAFIAFHYENPEGRSWRLSYLEKQDSNVNSTSAKRYTYLCGKDYPCRTLAERFALLDKQEKTAQNIEAAFSVEALSDEFFSGYRSMYQEFCDYVTAHRSDATLFGLEFATCDEKFIRDYVKKMMGRITFLHFLQRKGWLGQPRNIEGWGRGNLNFMHDLFAQASPEQQADFLDEILEPIFFECLNEKRDGDFFDTAVSGIRLVKIPYLNGGLFERDEIDKPRSTFPAEMFQRLFDFFGRYNFTIDESDPLDTEVGVDPEMLGKIFENLLEDNKDKGAFYTPKEIVNYMCREALIAYLVDEARRKSEVNKQRQDNFDAAIRAFVTDPDLTIARMRKYGEKQLDDLNKSLCDVRICDPAIGSGAFPMGLLNLLVTCRTALNEALDIDMSRAELKKEIIRNNIYGVDIEKGAIDIARLRFWLSIVVDLDDPEPLPNFDYKFMQGNSLLEQFEGVDLRELLPKEEKENGLRIIFSDEQAQYEVLRNHLEQFFKENNHERKQELRGLMNEAVKEFIRTRTAGNNSIAEAIEPVNVSANTKFFLWHTWFADVFKREITNQRPSNKSGFDIVIGNPPYGASLSKEDIAIFKSIYSDVHMRTPDTYNYFISNGIRLLSSNAVLSYIVPNTLLSQNEYEKTRVLLSKDNTLQIVVNLGEHVFEAAEVPTCIFMVKKGATERYNILYADFKDTDNSQIKWGEGYDEIPNEVLNEIPGHVIGVDLASASILKKVREKSVTIDSIAYEMAAGISTGCNDAFCLSKEEVNLHGIERDVLRPLLIGRNIDKYVLNWDSQYIIYTTKETPIEKYPNAEDFARPYKEKLDKRRETKNGLIPWWALNWPRYEDLFRGEKIIMRQTSDAIRAVYDDQNFYPLNSILTLRLNEGCGFSYKFVLGLLNCKLTNIVYQSITQEKGRTFAEVKPINVRKLYIPNINEVQQKPIIDLVDSILAKKKGNPNADTSAEESAIDNIVFDLYGLTEDERNLVEN